MPPASKVVAFTAVPDALVNVSVVMIPATAYRFVPTSTELASIFRLPIPPERVPTSKSVIVPAVPTIAAALKSVASSVVNVAAVPARLVIPVTVVASRESAESVPTVAIPVKFAFVPLMVVTIPTKANKFWPASMFCASTVSTITSVPRTVAIVAAVPTMSIEVSVVTIPV